MCIDVNGIEVKNVSRREQFTAEQFFLVSFVFVLFCHVYPERDSD